jgi:hypothetical protein
VDSTPTPVNVSGFVDKYREESDIQQTGEEKNGGKREKGMEGDKFFYVSHNVIIFKMGNIMLNEKLSGKPEMMACRDGFGDGVFELAKKRQAGGGADGRCEGIRQGGKIC